MTDNRHQRMRRMLPVLACAAGAFAFGALLGARSTSPREKLAQAFVAAWTRGDYPGMYARIDAAAQRRISASDFASSYEQALTAATATRLLVRGPARADGGGLITVPVTVQTRLFGSLRLDFALPTTAERGEGLRIAWSRALAFPGLRPGELLTRTSTLPRRAMVLTREGGVLAESAASADAAQSGAETRASPLGAVATAVLGTVEAAPAARRRALEAEGVPASASVGTSGLEEALDERLRGTPGGELLVVDARTGSPRRVLARAPARPAPPLRSSVSAPLQRAAVLALGGQLGGIVALEPATGQILAVAGLGLDGLQPPGSTFKMVTLTGLLEAGLASPHSAFPYASYATLDGVKLNNANGETCGGTLEDAFAISCNSVFAPLGVKLGAARLVATAERFGFNHDPGIAAAAASTLPSAAQIDGELALGSTAIGQGQVLATPLQMATVAATIADGGRRPTPTFLLTAGRAAAPRAIDADVARTVRRLMIGVVRFGTGTAAAIPGVVVAGKTGTAELQTPCRSAAPEAGRAEAASGEAGSQRCQGAQAEASNTDAWFAAFAPAVHPRIAVCVLLVKDGAGGETAAPVAREVLEAGLSAGVQP